MDSYKILTVWHPPGKTAHVTVGFWGFVGALTGFSAYSEDGATSTGGLTVHEANLGTIVRVGRLGTRGWSGGCS